MGIIFQDYFDSYPLGPGVPTGFILSGGTQSDFVTGGIDGSHAWQFNAFANRFFTPTASITQFLALWVHDTNANASVIALSNGDPSGAGIPRILFRMQGEPDSTWSFYAGDGFFLGNTGLPGFSYLSQTWYTMQLNITFSQTLVVGVPVVQLDFEVTFQGLISGAEPGGVYLTKSHIMPTIPVSGLFTGAAEVNNLSYQGPGLMLDSLTLETRVPLNSYPIPGSPVARVYQGSNEVMELPDNSLNRVTQGAIELSELPDDALCRVIQGVIELMVTGAVGARGWFPEYRRPRTFISNQ